MERLFRLDWDSREIEREAVERYPALADCFARTRGLRLLRPSSAEEMFFTFLCTPNNHLKRIGPMVRHLASYGPAIPGTTRRAFPSAATIADVREMDLRGAGFGYRGATIPRAAHELLERGEGWLQSLCAAPYERAFVELQTISGIGPKLADCICLFGLDHTRAVPMDTHMWQAARRLFGGELDAVAPKDRYRVAGEMLRAPFGERAAWVQQVMYYDNMLRGRQEKAPSPESGGA